jgi:hypothetical protein
VAAAAVPQARDLNARSGLKTVGYITETQLEFRRPRWPLLLMLGYRHEWLRLTPALGLVQIEETGRAIVGAGLAIGR